MGGLDRGFGLLVHSLAERGCLGSRGCGMCLLLSVELL